MKIPPLKIYFSQEDRKQVLSKIEECLCAGQVAAGKNVSEFELEFAMYVGTKYAIGVNSGGASIEIVMRTLGIKDKEVIIPTNTFFATAGAVILAGGKIRLVDISASTFSLTLEDIKKAVGANTAGVIVVHIGGIITPEIELIRQWCAENNLWLFEDCAHAHASKYNGRMAGTFGLAGGYSFFATKVITSGEGGMIVTDNDALARKARVLRDYGKPEPWVSYHTDIGANWRMNELAAILGLAQLRRLDGFVKKREEVAKLYTRLLEGVPEVVPVLPKGRSSWYKYIVLLPKEADREKLRLKMKAEGVTLSGGIYELPLHRQPVFENIADGLFPVADDICSRHICLPIYYDMKEEEAEYVIKALAKNLKEAGK